MMNAFLVTMVTIIPIKLVSVNHFGMLMFDSVMFGGITQI